MEDEFVKIKIAKKDRVKGFYVLVMSGTIISNKLNVFTINKKLLEKLDTKEIQYKILKK